MLVVFLLWHEKTLADARAATAAAESRATAAEAAAAAAQARATAAEAAAPAERAALEAVPAHITDLFFALCDSRHATRRLEKGLCAGCRLRLL